jgi:hypothetical protein
MPRPAIAVVTLAMAMAGCASQGRSWAAPLNAAPCAKGGVSSSRAWSGSGTKMP